MIFIFIWILLFFFYIAIETFFNFIFSRGLSIYCCNIYGKLSSPKRLNLSDLYHSSCVTHAVTLCSVVFCSVCAFWHVSTTLTGPDCVKTFSLTAFVVSCVQCDGCGLLPSCPGEILTFLKIYIILMLFSCPLLTISRPCSPQRASARPGYTYSCPLSSQDIIFDTVSLHLTSCHFQSHVTITSDTINLISCHFRPMWSLLTIIVIL